MVAPGAGAGVSGGTAGASRPAYHAGMGRMVALALAVVAAIGCGGGDDQQVGGDAAVDLDADTDAALDAGLDADVDAPDPGTVVTVRTLDRADQPVAGVPVYGHDPAGQVIDQAVTSDAGVAWLAVPAGGAITARDQVANPPQWYSVFAVAPGDDIAIHLERGQVPVREVSVTVPALPAGATRARVAAPCGEDWGGAGNLHRLRIDQRCPDHGPLVATAADDSSLSVGYLVLPDADFTQAAIVMSGGWETPIAPWDADVTGFPAGGGTVQVVRTALSGGYQVGWEQVWITTTASSASATGREPGVGDGVLYQLTTRTGDFCAGGVRAYHRASVQASIGLAVDLGALVAPITGVSYADHQIGWAGGGDGVGVVVSFTAAEGSGDVVGPRRAWTAVAPSGATALTFPDGVGFVWPPGPGQGDRITAIQVSELASTRWPSYQALRQRDRRWPIRLGEDLVMRTSSFQRQYAYLGCPFALAP